jgi:thiol-disulfide isomerase/thioredoxin
MDRLSFVATPMRVMTIWTMAACAIVTGCEEGTAEPAPSRVVAIGAGQDNSAAELCDVSRSAGDAPALTFPTLASGSAPAPSGSPRWLNVWATWCRPCVEELPMILEWGGRMRASGASVELTFLSADASDEAVATFRQAHPNAPETLRAADARAIRTWVTSVGLDEGAPLPIHVFTDGMGRVRCARAGAVAERDYEAVRSVLASYE